MKPMDAGGEFAKVPEAHYGERIPQAPRNLRLLWQLERRQRHEAHYEARDRFELLSAEFGQGDKNQAYFASPIESGKRRVLLVTGDEAYHIILNDETVSVPAASTLYYAEWALSPHECLAAFRQSTVRRPDLTQGWGGVIKKEAFLFAHVSGFRVVRGDENELVMPPRFWCPTGTETLDMRDHLQALNIVLGGLNAVMHEPLDQPEIRYD